MIERLRWVRLGFVAILLAAALRWVWRTDIQADRVTLLVTAVIAAVTSIYALFTYEILIENEAMSKATSQTAMLMERSLRFSHAPKLLFETVATKNPTSILALPISNEDYKRALEEYSANQGQSEFIFAVVTNKGQGTATDVEVSATYKLVDSSNPNREAVVTKAAIVPILEPNVGIALCIFISKTATPDDGAALISAKIAASDFYRDANQEPPQTSIIEAARHQTRRESECVLKLS